MSPKQAFRARLAPKVTRQVCKTTGLLQQFDRQVSKTSVSHETSSKAASSLQNECVARDLLQKSHVLYETVSSFSRSQSLLAASRLPAPATKSALPHLPHAQSTVPATKSDDMTPSCQQSLQHTFRMMSTRSENTPTHQTRLRLRLVVKAQLRSNSLKHKSQCHSRIQHPKNTTL